MFTYDNTDSSQLIQVSPDIVTTLQNGTFIAFINQNDRVNPRGGTPQPGTNIEMLYYASPTGGSRIPILQLDTTTDDQIYIAPGGSTLAYFREGSSIASTGLYVVDLGIGFSGRVLTLTSMGQRGFVSTPSWSPDGRRLAIAVATGYDIDIYTVGSDGSNPRSETDHGAYDFFPQWSPDGRYIAFVSDRATCPSWRPGEPDTCDGSDTPPPIGGTLHLLDLQTGAVSQLSEQFLTEPPRWISPRLLTYASGDPLFGDTERAIFTYDIVSRAERRLQAAGGGDDPIKISETWSPDGGVVLYQSASTTTSLVMMNSSGSPIGRTSDFNFVRYGMRAHWSPGGELVAVGGADGQCPYGLLVFNRAFETVVRAGTPPSACDPLWSPDGRFLAYMGVRPSATGSLDGRIDLYVANSSGFGASNLTANLDGTTQMLRWVGGG
jgi:Tol biopolymer transport system component